MEQNTAALAANKITVQEMYDITERNYGWESFKYSNPRKYKSPTFIKGVSNGSFGLKDNYLDQLQNQKKKIPGPCDYNSTGIKTRPKSGKMDKKQRMTMTSQVKDISTKENIPGPGAYFKRPKSAMEINNSTRRTEKKDKKDHYLNEVQYLAIVGPGVGQYNLTTPSHVSSPQIMKKANKSRMEMKQQIISNLNTMNCVEKTFAWHSNRKKNKNSYYFGMSQRFKTESKSKKKPGPNSYQLNSDWSSKNNLTRVTSVKGSLMSKNVYYH